MNLTIPIRAQNSTSSWSRQLRGNSSIKGSNIDRKRYIFSLIAAALLVGTLITGSVGGMLQIASARDNYSSRNYNYSPRYDQNRQDYTTTYRQSPSADKNGTSNNTSPSSNTKYTDPQSPTRTTRTPPAAPAPVATPVVTTQPVVTEKTTPAITPPLAPTPVDTTPAIANMTAAQADKNTQAVSYTSGRLSDDTRNRIFMLAGVAAVVGVLLYMISFIGTSTPKPTHHEIPIRYIVPVKEVITN